MKRRRLNYLFIVAAVLSLNPSAASTSPGWLGKIPGLQTTKIQDKNEVGAGAVIPDFEDPFFSGYSGLAEKPRRSSRNWLGLCTENCLRFLRNPRVISAIQCGLLAYLAVEIVRAAREVYKEYLEDPDEDMGISHSSNAILSPTAARKLVLWLGQEQEERGEPPSISPRWMIGVAQDLYSCHALSVGELYRVLLSLTKSQAVLLQSSLLKPSKTVSFSSSGLAALKGSIKDWISTNLKFDSLNPSDKTPFDDFVSKGRQGLVLWGPPGCGKSMIMQAIADQSGWPTLVVTPSLLQRKWFGESTNQVRSLFGLVSLLGRCTVVLDELDGLFRARSRDEHDASRELKTEWLQWWDGAASTNLHRQNKVVVVAATNRPWDVDPAVWRRLPQRFYVGVPTWDDRCDLVHKIVNTYKLPAIHPSVVEHLADSTEGYTPSDLFQILQCACRKGPMARDDLEVTMEDVQLALNEVPPTRFATQYIHQLQDFLGVPNHASHQQASPVSYNPDMPSNWKTPIGNFCEINVPVDSEVFDIMEDYLWRQIEWESSSDEDYEEESEEEEDP
eukprot:CAMPEP_0117062604 /NCGR_PEP_ID=MMETSP0472-20121206/43628_1 /TAXON_ID=693140 ORGANISM="Tiarina fusus, Strain LIS" /NCGR_SAMPLE_ID=MMETSP0472 /ASSEMBLY_ACC=CAM_ASM_000603 /LENGTH=558 /DNA_ID=CAMNT_0004781827 /DNA_START=36 /DNA_END=1712 /DNA_ORIENTATION=+